MNSVIILGGGPGSVFSYFGAVAAGYDPAEVQIWSEGLTYPPGAFWLHKLPPNCPIKLQPQDLKIILLGDAETYSKRQWGKVYPNSASRLGGTVMTAYDPQDALGKLWQLCNVAYTSVRYDIHSVLDLAERVDRVIVTFPITHRAVQESKRLKVPVYHNTPQKEFVPSDNEYCLYNGLSVTEESTSVEWVRLTKAFGKVSIEYPHNMAMQSQRILDMETRIWGPGGTVTMVPELHPETVACEETIIGRRRNILITGRWATVNRKALSHDSWMDTYRFLTGKDSYEDLPSL